MLREILHDETADARVLAALFEAVANADRLALVEELARGPATATTAAARLKQKRSASAFHGRMLRKAEMASLRGAYLVLEPERLRTLARFFDRAWRVASITSTEPAAAGPRRLSTDACP